MNPAELFYDLQTSAQKQLASAHGMTREGFIRWAEQKCILEPVVIDEKVVGVIALNGDVLHAAVSPSAKGRWLRQLQRFIERQGRNLVTMADKQDASANAFLVKAGAQRLSESEHVVRYAVKQGELWFNRER